MRRCRLGDNGEAQLRLRLLPSVAGFRSASGRCRPVPGRDLQTWEHRANRKLQPALKCQGNWAKLPLSRGGEVCGTAGADPMTEANFFTSELNQARPAITNAA